MTTRPNLGFVHRYVPATNGDSRTLLLLHGTGGNEGSLLGVGKLIAPTASLLSPRGQVLEHGMPRFFRRHAEGVFDEADMRKQAEDLRTFVAVSAAAYGFDQDAVVAVGFSNGANIAAAMMLTQPKLLAAAILFSPMVPLRPPQIRNLGGTPVFIGASRQDTLVPQENTEELAQMLQDSGASMTVFWHPSGHSIVQEEVAAAAAWLGQMS